MTTCRMVVEPCVKRVCQTICETVTRPVRQDRARDHLRDADDPVRRKVPYTTCRQVADTKTICCPVTVPRQVTEYKTVCVPRTVCRQVPVEVCVKVPVVVHCPPVVLPSCPERDGLGPVAPAHVGAALRSVRQQLPDRRQEVQHVPLVGDDLRGPPRTAAKQSNTPGQETPPVRSPGAFLLNRSSALVIQAAEYDQLLQAAAEAREARARWLSWCLTSGLSSPKVAWYSWIRNSGS